MTFQGRNCQRGVKGRLRQRSGVWRPFHVFTAEPLPHSAVHFLPVRLLCTTPIN